MAQKSKKRRFIGKMKLKLRFAIMGILAVFVLLMIRVVYITITAGKEYEKQVLVQQGYQSVILPFKRGDILDANGTVLATSKKVYNVILEPKNILEKDEYVGPTSAAVKKYFGISDADMSKYLAQEDSYYVVAAKKIEYEQVKEFQEFCKTDEGKNVVGVWFEEEYKRVYPNDELACHVLGYTVSGNVGESGLEQYYNRELNGSNGRRYSYINDSNDLEQTVELPVNGYNLITTIDAKIQSIVQEKVDAYMEETGAKNVSVLVMSPKDCSVLAMYNCHKFNPNDAYDLNYTRYQFDSDEEFEDFVKNGTDEDHVNALYKVWRNFTISDVFEPGSTYKTFTIASCLQEGVYDIDDTFTCTGGEQVSNYYIQCSHTHGTITLSQALEYSCNDALMQIGKAEGPEMFDRYQQLFGFGQSTNIDLPGEPDDISMSTLVYHRDTLNPVELATSSFGQGVTVTMIELGTGFCSVINGGYYYQPHIVKQIVDEDGNVVEDVSKILVRRTISEDVSAQVRQSLYGVVEGGTGGRASVEGYAIGGKTGTAEKIPRNQGNYILSFIGFCPIDDPQVVIYVVVDEPNVEIQVGNPAAKIIFAEIAEEVFPYMNIYREDEEDFEWPEEVYTEGTPIYAGDVPDSDVAGGDSNPYVNEDLIGPTTEEN